MTTLLHEQLRDAADACTPSPLQDLLRRAADAVEVKQEPFTTGVVYEYCLDGDDESDEGECWKTAHMNFYKGLFDRFNVGDKVYFYLHPAPIPDGMMLVPVNSPDMSNDMFGDSPFVVRRSVDKRAYEVVEALNGDWREVVANDPPKNHGYFDDLDEAESVRNHLHMQRVLRKYAAGE